MKKGDFLYNLYLILEQPQKHEYGFFIQKLLLINVIINIFSFTLPSIVYLDENTRNMFFLIDKITTYVFLIELILRITVSTYNEKYRGIKGKLKFFIHPYTIIDILAVLPLIPYVNNNLSFLKLFRFARLLKLIKYKNIIKQLISIEYFASAPVLTQFTVLFVLSLFIILIFSYIFHSIKISFLLFLDPSNIIKAHDIYQIIFGIIELIIGLIVGSFLVSIITSTLVMITEKANKGLLSYKGKNHIIIVNYNSTLEFILNEIDKYFADTNEQKKDIVLFLPNIENIEKYKADLHQYKNIDIYVMSGEVLNENSYNRINVNKAEKILFLLDNENINKKQVRYILQMSSFTNEKLEFVIEDEGENLNEIYDAIFDKHKNRYLYFHHNKLLNNLLNRTIVNNLYFNIFSELLTFDGYEFYIRESKIFFDKEITFEDAYLSINNAILIGIYRNEKVIVNPPLNEIITPNDKLILIMENETNFNIKAPKYFSDIYIIKKPKLKEHRKICIVGEYSDVKSDEITEFLDENSVKSLIHIRKENGDYMDKELWTSIQKDKSIDSIILNLEDNYEMELTFYLRSVFKDDKKFLSKIINILRTPAIANLLYDEEFRNNVILSEKIIGEYISKILFEKEVEKIFDELTHEYGNEMYILSKKDYPHLYAQNYDKLKYNLIKNNMIYLGSFINNKFTFDNENIKDSENIVVLTQGQ